MAVKLGNGNWAVKEDKLLAYNDNSGLFFNKEFDFSRGSTATYVGRDGLIASAASGVPRIDFTNDTKGHLLLEPSSTNVITYSNGFDDSSWDETNVTVTENSLTSPDGTNNAWLLQVTSNNERHFLRVGSATTSTVSISIFAKKGTTDYAYFFCGGTTNIQAIFDLSDGSVTDSGAIGSGSSLTSVSSISLGNGWYRLQISGTFSSPPANRIGILPYYQSTFDGNPATSWQGNGENIYIYGAMEENNSYSTSYIPTTGAASTRNADVCNNSGSAQDFNSEEGVLYAEIAALTQDLGSSNEIISISDGTLDNRINIYHKKNLSNTIAYGIESNNVIHFFESFTISDITSFHKVAFKFKQNDCALWVDGNEVDTQTSVSMPSGLNSLQFDVGNGTSDFYGKVRNVQVFTEALTDEQLEKLTS